MQLDVLKEKPNEHEEDGGGELLYFELSAVFGVGGAPAGGPGGV